VAGLDSQSDAGENAAGNHVERRCAGWARANGIDPIGTAGSYAGFVLVEWPLPWARDVADIAHLAALVQRATAAQLRVQLLAPRTGRRGESLVSLFRWKPDTGRFHAREVTVATELVAEAACALVEDEDEGAGADGEAWTGHTLLVCGHGRRDRCCGSLGVALELALAGSETPGDLRVYRTSHTGGHRFAPTAILLPEGTSWAYLDPDLARAVVDRSLPSARMRPHYRGCAGLASSAAQALEGAVFEEVGWSLFDRPRSTGLVLGQADVLELHIGGHRAETWRAHVAPGRRVPVPVCGKDISASEKDEVEFVVSGLERMPDNGGTTPGYESEVP